MSVPVKLPMEPAGSSAEDPLPAALNAMRTGKPVLVLDDSARENECDVILPAALTHPRWTAWAIRRTSGLLCAPLPAERADELDLPPMVRRNADPFATAYTISVDAATGVGSGISAADRTRTAQVLADPASTPRDLVRPGHILPLRARPGGVIARPGHTEAGVDLCRLAGLPPVALIAELVNDDGSMSRRRAAIALAQRTELPVLDLSDIVRHRLYHGDGVGARVTRAATTRVPTSRATLDAVIYRDELTGAEHLVITAPGTTASRPLVALHLECLLGDVFGSSACSCSRHLNSALARVGTEGGAVVYLRRPSGAPLTAHKWTMADDGAAAAVLADLGMTQVRLVPGSASAHGLAFGGITAYPAIPGAAAERWRPDHGWSLTKMPGAQPSAQPPLRPWQFGF